jgi:hypothetical protein
MDLPKDPLVRSLLNALNQADRLQRQNRPRTEKTENCCEELRSVVETQLVCGAAVFQHRATTGVQSEITCAAAIPLAVVLVWAYISLHLLMVIFATLQPHDLTWFVADFLEYILSQR